jgi:hypothetical protein
MPISNRIPAPIVIVAIGGSGTRVAAGILSVLVRSTQKYSNIEKTIS